MPGSPFGNFLNNEITYMANVLGQGRVPYVAPTRTLKPKQQSPFTSISSDQLPKGAYMTEPGRVYGVDSEQVGRLGGYMDETGRVFLPSNNKVTPASWAAPSSSLRSPSATATQPVNQRLTVPVAEAPAATRAYESEKARVAQLTAQDPELQRYEKASAAAKTQEEMDAARDIGMAIWARSNPKLAAKVKPGQSGYEVIQNELGAGQVGPVKDLPFDATKPLSPTPIPPEQRNVTYQGINPIPIPGADPVVPVAFGTPQTQMFETFRQAIAPGPNFQGSPLGTTPQTAIPTYGAQLGNPLGTPVSDESFRSEKAKQLAQMFMNAQMGR